MRPRLRFPEFSTEWQKQILGKAYQVNPRSPSLPSEFKYVDLESVIDGRLLKLKKIYKVNAPSRAQRVLSTNDLLFQTVRPYQKNNLFFRLADDNYVASTGYAQIRSSINSSSFLYQLIHTEKFNKKVMSRCTGSSYPAINSNDLAKIKIYIPEKAEQEKIADFLSAVDEKIDLENQKLENLEKYKKSITQQIFTQKLRFPEFSEDWGSIKLDQILVDGSKIPVKNTNDYKKITIGLYKKGIKESPNQSRIMADTRPFYIRKANEIIIGKQNYFSGSIAIIDDEFDGSICSNAIMSFSVKSKFNVRYVYEFISRTDFLEKRKSLANGTGQKELSEAEFLNFEIKVPELAEQQKIADFLSSIDEKLDLQKTKLNQIKNFKKSLLQRMFV